MSLLNKENKTKATGPWMDNIEVIHHDPRIRGQIYDLICNISPENLFNLKGIIPFVADIQWNFQLYQRIDYMTINNGYAKFQAKLHEGFTCTIKMDGEREGIYVLFDKKLLEIPSIGQHINKFLGTYTIDEEYYHAF